MEAAVPAVPAAPGTTAWWWYLVAALVPVVGIVVGIVAAAKNRVGPALALWATSFLAAWVWAGIIVGIVAAIAAGQHDSYTYYQP